MSRELFRAIRSAKVQPVREALAGGADPNAQDRLGTTAPPPAPVAPSAAVATALIGSSAALVTALLDAGADVNASDKDGVRPLDFAMLYGTPATIRLLIGRGAEVNYVRHDGDTALMAAAGGGDLKVVE